MHPTVWQYGAHRFPRAGHGRAARMLLGWTNPPVNRVVLLLVVVVLLLLVVLASQGA